MIIKVSDSIISPLGVGSEENFIRVSKGESMLRRHEDAEGLLQPYYASLFTERRVFSELCIEAAEEALWGCGVDASSDKVLFVVSTTKGEDLELYHSSGKIAKHFGNKNGVIVVSNACTSGVCAQITAARMLNTGKYDTAIVVGCDIQTPFIVSGFQSFKALSDELCRPFDGARRGLNLGEAAAAMILRRTDDIEEGQWEYVAGGIHNDANHISGPSRTGEGALRCLNDVRNGDFGDMAFVNLHGTASLYNDDMESVAINRAGLGEMPVNSLKGYYGHTMGAAGVLETILSMKAVEHNIVLGTRGLVTVGTVENVNASNENRSCGGNGFVKLLSGFGGSNAAVRWRIKR